MQRTMLVCPFNQWDAINIRHAGIKNMTCNNDLKTMTITPIFQFSVIPWFS